MLPAIDMNLRPRNVSGLIGAQEGHEVSDARRETADSGREKAQ